MSKCIPFRYCERPWWSLGFTIAIRRGTKNCWFVTVRIGPFVFGLQGDGEYMPDV